MTSAAVILNVSPPFTTTVSYICKHLLCDGRLRGRRFRACSKADMLSMVEAQAVKSLSKTDLLRGVGCECKLLMLHLF